MPFLANVVNVMIACPSDIEGELTICQQEIHEWNVMHAQERQLVLLPRHWSTHSRSEVGVAPQAAIDRQVLAEADLLVAIFGHRMGTALADSPSGTAHEIEEHRARNGAAMIFFSEKPVNAYQADATEIEKVKAYRKEMKEASLYKIYKSDEEFRDVFRKDLHMTVISHYGKTKVTIGSAKPAEELDTSSLSKDAKLLLACGSETGEIAIDHHMSGSWVTAGNYRFTLEGDYRGQIRKIAIRLENLGFIKNPKPRKHGELLELTARGLSAGEELLRQELIDPANASLFGSAES